MQIKRVHAFEIRISGFRLSFSAWSRLSGGVGPCQSRRSGSGASTHKFFRVV